MLKSKLLCRRTFGKTAILLLFVFLTLAPLSLGQTQSTVFYLDEAYHPLVNLKGLQPLSKGIKAILAMYALQAGGGCQGADESGLRCRLATALGLGAQCSPEHVNLVQSWFKNGMPRMSGYRSDLFLRGLETDELRSICYKQPETATHQEIWEIIRIEKKNDTVNVDAISSWTVGSDGPSGRKRYKTVYRIDSHDIAVLSHEEVSPGQRAK